MRFLLSEWLRHIAKDLLLKAYLYLYVFCILAFVIFKDSKNVVETLIKVAVFFFFLFFVRKRLKVCSLSNQVFRDLTIEFFKRSYITC